jgi:hypothetical protein
MVMKLAKIDLCLCLERRIEICKFVVVPPKEAQTLEAGEAPDPANAHTYVASYVPATRSLTPRYSVSEESINEPAGSKHSSFSIGDVKTGDLDGCRR